MIKSPQSPIDDILLKTLQQRRQIEQKSSDPTLRQANPDNKADGLNQDRLDLSKQPSQKEEQDNNPQAETSVIDNGFRRTDNFTTADGKSFTRIEEVTSTPNRTKRIVIQQNETGSTTQAENIIDRQEDGSFRLTQRFTNEIGETKTNIEFNYTPQNADIILGRLPESTGNNRTPNPFETLRGTQIDLRA